MIKISSIYVEQLLTWGIREISFRPPCHENQGCLAWEIYGTGGESKLVAVIDLEGKLTDERVVEIPF